MKGLILFAHGARDPRWAEPFERLRELVRARSPELPVALAFLELMQPDLKSALQGLIGQGCTAITVIPVFLGQGGHVRRDLPELIMQLRQSYPHIDIDCATAVGEDAAVLNAIADYCLQAGSVGLRHL